MKPEDRIAEIDGFMHFALGEWPALRSSVVNELARRCEKCILSEKASPIREGVCEACRGSSAGGQPRRAEPDFDALRASLDELLREQGGRGSRAHDALVLYSGGKDSTLLVHKLTTEYPRLRILCLMVDNGFASPVALANTRRVFERIDADHFVYKPRASLFRKTFRHAFTHLGRGGCYGTVDRLDGELTFDIGRNLAASLQIPLLIIGLSGEQCERILGLSNFESPREWEREKRTVEE
ncbi:MAG TPA: hypothetical protein VK780_08450, partial [Thermoanaerobaculia bacterium]|nr:hypothetical protein [Thermoanaerobaculia bacterium]